MSATLSTTIPVTLGYLAIAGSLVATLTGHPGVGLGVALAAVPLGGIAYSANRTGTTGGQVTLGVLLGALIAGALALGRMATGIF